MARLIKFEDLPPPFLVGVFCVLEDIKEIASLQMTCQRLYSIGRSRSVWLPLIKRETGLNIKVDSEFDDKNLKKFCMMGKNEIESLRFWGVYTDGGCDEEWIHYWVDNLFMANHWGSYCSDLGKNVNCIGLLLDEVQEADKKREDDREYMIRKCRYPAARLFNQRLSQGAIDSAFNMLQCWSLAELEYFFVSLYDEIQGNGNLGMMLEVGLRESELPQERRRMNEFIENLKVKRSLNSRGIDIFSEPDEKEKSVIFDTNLTSAVCSRPPSAPDLIGVFSELSICRKGSYSCPVASGAIFIATLTGLNKFKQHQDFTNFFQDICNSGYCHLFNDLSDMKSIAVLIEEKKLPQILSVGHDCTGEWIEFDQRCCEGEFLKPAVWFRFWSAQEYIEILNRIDDVVGSTNEHRTLDTKGTRGRDSLNVRLTRKISGNLMCVKLISPENLMDEFDDHHSEPNIDVNSIYFSGKKFTLPNGVSLIPSNNF